jgi:hypothetical protein
MKSLKILSLVAAVLFAVACGEKENNPDGPVAKDGVLTGEWVLTSWNETAPEFNVYIDFNDDNTFQIYQQVWSFDYEFFTGTYNISGDIVTGSYADGSNWACGYKFVKDGDTLTMYSQEDTSVTSIYKKCEIPAEIKDEATATRSAEVVPFL